VAVLDASFIVKLVIREPCSGSALAALEEMAGRGEELHAPCIAAAEVANALWRHARLLRDVPVEAARRGLGRLERLLRLVELHPAAGELLGDALRLALEEGVTVYDALYLALAARLRQPLYTYDEKLAEAARGAGVETVVPGCG